MAARPVSDGWRLTINLSKAGEHEPKAWFNTENPKPHPVAKRVWKSLPVYKFIGANDRKAKNTQDARQVAKGEKEGPKTKEGEIAGEETQRQALHSQVREQRYRI